MQLSSKSGNGPLRDGSRVAQGGHLQDEARQRGACEERVVFGAVDDDGSKVPAAGLSTDQEALAEVCVQFVRVARSLRRYEVSGL